MSPLGKSPCPPPEPSRAIRTAGRESVWDYPRPPRVEPAAQLLQVCFNGVLVAESSRTWRVLETSHPPVYYFPPKDVWQPALRPSQRRTFCEYKGVAIYFDVLVGDRVAEAAAWSYPDPTSGNESIRGFLAFYPAKMDRCFVDGEEVIPQVGDFYGGWITNSSSGPFTGVPSPLKGS